MNTRSLKKPSLFRRAKQALAVFCSLLMLSVLLTACELTPEEKSALEFALAQDFEGEGPNPPAPPVAPACFNERFVQPEAQISKSVDLLFVTDTSSSLDAERKAVANGIDAFVQELPSNVDYQIGVMLAHGSRANFSGRLWQKSSRGPVLSSKTMSLNQIRNDLRYLLTNVSEDSHSDGGEEGLYSLLRAFDHGPLTSSRAKGFFREDAALAVIFIADENDICAQYPAGVTPVKDSNNSEGPAKARDCAGVTPQVVLNKIKEVQGNRPFLVGGIVYNNHETYPRGGENEYGYGYLDLIQLANGISVDLAGSRYNEGLADIGRLTTIKLNLILDFTLARPEIDPETIEVAVDGREIDYAYNPAENEVHLSEGGSARSVVDIGYCLKATPVPEPTSNPSPEPCVPDSEGTNCGPGPAPEPTASPSPNPVPSPDPSPVPSPVPTTEPCTGDSCGGVPGGGL